MLSAPGRTPPRSVVACGVLPACCLLLACCGGARTDGGAERFDVDIAVREEFRNRAGAVLRIGKVVATHRDPAYVVGAAVSADDEHGALRFSVTAIDARQLRAVVEFRPAQTDQAPLRVERILPRDGRTGLTYENARARIILRPVAAQE